MRQSRRARYDGYNNEQWTRALADDFDELEGILDEHIAEDEAAFAKAAEAFQAWKLETLQASRRTSWQLVIALVPILISLLVILATK